MVFLITANYNFYAFPLKTTENSKYTLGAGFTQIENNTRLQRLFNGKSPLTVNTVLY